MASRRFLKKNINYIADLALGLCIYTGAYKTSDQDTIDELIKKVRVARLEALTRINHTEPGNVNLFYKKLKEDFSNATTEVFAKLQELTQK
ncbi:hypothetical protein [uncultured Phocaeicola sp.]|jgi:hypothetical protein|uniref:hypothetical protein n=1 Tax=uncultured Phocaeicola sp. TaxID=990718 RepID=UPI0015B0B4F1|nr:hypothetical protein [uncultured Phocaeicola sp.]